MNDLVPTAAEQTEGPRAFSIPEAIKEGGIENTRITDFWRPRWEHNFVSGYHLIRPDTMNLRVLSMKHDKQAILVVSTGPSLDRNIEELKQLDRSGFGIMASTSALNPLIVNGIIPDYAIINDGAPWVADLHFAGLEAELEKVPLIIATTCHPTTAERYPGPRLYYHDFAPDDPLLSPEGLLYRMLPQFTGIPVGGCTTNCAVRVSVMLGFTRMVLIGSDLAFPGGRSHCTKYERGEVEWEPLPINEEFYKKKARWLFHTCPKGCTYVVHEWEPDKPIEWDDKLKACADCKAEMRHVATSAEYMFYLSNLINVAEAGRMKVDINGDAQIRDYRVINATGDGIATLMENAPLAEAFTLEAQKMEEAVGEAAGASEKETEEVASG